MDERDYLAEVDGKIDAITQGSGWVAAVLADKLYTELAETDPELLDGFLHEAGRDTLRRHITNRTNAHRLRERASAEQGRFADAARNYAEGRDEGGKQLLGMFALTHVVTEGQLRKRAGEMTGTDHQFVAEQYTVRGNRALMEAAFHSAVAKKVKGKRTDEVYTLEQYEAMYRSITGTKEG